MLTDNGNRGKFGRCRLSLRETFRRLSLRESTPVGEAEDDKTALPRASLLRIVRLVAVMAALAASLVSFPAGVPWMVAGWLAVFTWGVARGHRGFWCLATMIVVILIKRVDWPPGLWLTFATFAVVALVLIINRRRDGKLAPRGRFAALGAVWLAWMLFAYDWHRSAHANHLVAPFDARPIVCLGDSLTSLGTEGGYPEVLATMVAAPVVNLGQPGITSAEALKQLPALRAARPQAVVIELGGHDFLKDATLFKRRSRAATKQNLARFITAAQEIGAEVVLIEIPRAFISDPFAGLERELAREYDVELVPDTVIREFVLYSPYAPPGTWTGGPYLSDDGLHPNARGNELMARHVAGALERFFGPVARTLSDDTSRGRK